MKRIRAWVIALAALALLLALATLVAQPTQAWPDSQARRQEKGTPPAPGAQAVLTAQPTEAWPALQVSPQDKPTPAAPGTQAMRSGVALQRSEPATSAPSGPASVIMSQNFEGAWPAAGWNLLDLSSNDGGEYLWGKRNCYPHSGNYGGWSVGGGQQGSGLPCGSNYPNYTSTWADYGPFDLQGATSASLTFYFWGRTEYEPSCSYDQFFSGSSIDGSNYNGAIFCGDWTGGPAGNGYYQYTLDLSSRLGQSQVWVTFGLLTDLSVAYNGITVDDITLDVTGRPTDTPTPTPTPTRTPTPTPTRTLTPTPTRTTIPTRRSVSLPLVGRQATATPTTPGSSVWQPAGLRDRSVRNLTGTANGTLAGGERINQGPGGVSQASACSVNWTSLGIPDRSVFALARTGNGALYAGTYGNGILRSTNNGGNWELVNNGIPLQTGNKIYIYGVAAHPSNANILLAASLFSGALRTTNGGSSWQRTSPAGANDWLAVVFDYSNGNLAYGGTRGRGFHKSTNGGASWTESNSGLTNPDVWAIAVAASNPNILFAGTTSGVFRSTNAGASWQPAGLSGKKVRSLAVDPQNANVIYAGTEFDSVWISNNGGAGWQNASSGMPGNLAIWSLKLDPSCNRALAGSRSGVYQRSLSGNIPTPTPTPPPSGWTTIASEYFEGAFPRPGWLVADDYSGGGEYYWGKRSCRSYNGTYSGWSVGAGAQGSGLSCGANYPNEAFSWLIYGPFSLVGAADAEFVFQSWYNTETSYDALFWGASLNGTNFYGTSVDGSSGSWVPQNFDLTNVYTLGNLTGQPQVWIAFVFITDSSVTYPEGAYVDDIVLRKRAALDFADAGEQPPAPCVIAGEDAPPDTPRCTSLTLEGPDPQKPK